MDVNWSLLGGGNNALQMFDYGRKIGQETRARQREDQYRGAATVYAKDPSEQNLNALMPFAEPQQVMQIAQQRQQAARKSQEQRRADLPLLTRLVETSTDEASYQRNRAVAQEYGIDTSTLPPQFDPAWRDQQLVTLKALQDPSKAEALSTAGKQAIDMGYKPGTPEFNQAVREIWQAGESKPYVVGGETRLYTPKIGGQGQTMGGPQPGHIEDGYRFKGGNPADRNSWEPVGQGGGGARVTSSFLDGL
jgi:hypothetical protein